jgi:hypothetical protein
MEHSASEKPNALKVEIVAELKTLITTFSPKCVGRVEMPAMHGLKSTTKN